MSRGWFPVGYFPAKYWIDAYFPDFGEDVIPGPQSRIFGEVDQYKIYGEVDKLSVSGEVDY
jgi:hypothetical protein